MSENTEESPPPEDFDYGEQREDGQYENYPTIDEGEFRQKVRSVYIHEECGGTTTMKKELAESVARNPDYYSKTFCVTCEEYVPVEEVHWKENEKSWVIEE